jgi:hypothetical protein
MQFSITVDFKIKAQSDFLCHYTTYAQSCGYLIQQPIKKKSERFEIRDGVFQLDPFFDVSWRIDRYQTPLYLAASQPVEVEALLSEPLDKRHCWQPGKITTGADSPGSENFGLFRSR